jgi:hypothetical protein
VALQWQAFVVSMSELGNSGNLWEFWELMGTLGVCWPGSKNVAFSSTLTYDPTHRDSLPPSTAHWCKSFVISELWGTFGNCQELLGTFSGKISSLEHLGSFGDCCIPQG